MNESAKPSRICLCLTSRTLKQNQDILEQYRSNIQIAELRTDLLNPTEWQKIKTFSKKSPVPLILCCRLPQDGGLYQGSEENRIDFLIDALNGNFAYIDVELETNSPELEKKAEKTKTRIIRSYHDFNGTPENLVDLIEKFPNKTNEIMKIAVTPESTRDLHRLYQASQASPERDKILLAMGTIGFPSRVLAAKFSSFLTYTSARETTQAAPGHSDPDTMEKIYRFSKITKKTAVFGIIGNPVMHTKSPLIHNGWFNDKNIDAVYCPFETDNAEDFFSMAEDLSINGFSVTIPHKQAVIPFLGRKDSSVDAIKACNTVFHLNGRWQGTNTDKDGFLLPLLQSLKTKDLFGLKATVIGAGGAARACIYALKNAGADVLILNRTEAKAISLAREFDCQYAPLSDDALKDIQRYNDLIIQTTGLGMNDGKDPLPFYPFSGNEFVYDIIYSPPITPLMERAAKQGCMVLGGYRMLEEQAVEQFKWFCKTL